MILFIPFSGKDDGLTITGAAEVVTTSSPDASFVMIVSLVCMGISDSTDGGSVDAEA